MRREAQRVGNKSYGIKGKNPHVTSREIRRGNQMIRSTRWDGFTEDEAFEFELAN